jgi:multiple sugar transport system substrate-binding protein
MDMKRLILILGTVLLAMAFFSCGKSEKSAPGSKIEIICMVQSSPEAQFVKAVADAYNAEPGHENVTVVINELGRDNVFPRIQNQLFTKSAGVDFFFVTPSLIGSLAEGGVLEDLSPYFDNPEIKSRGFSPSVFTPGGIESGTYNGTLYGLPFVTSTMLLFYRTDLIPNPPRTWDEYLETARRFTRSLNPSSPTPYGTTVVGKPQQDGINLIEYAQILWSKGGELVGPNNNIQVNLPINVQTLDYWAGLFKNKLTPPDANTYDYTSIVAAFQEEQVAMCIQWDAAASEWADPQSSPKVYDKFAVTIIPGERQSDSSILHKPYLNNWVSAVNKFSGHKAETFDFLSYLYNTDVFIKHMDPSMTTALNDVIASDEFRSFKESSHSYEAYKQSLAEGRSYVSHRDLDTIKSILDSALNQVMVNVLDSKTALDGAAREISELTQK